MEKFRFVKRIKKIESKNITIEQITTDRHVQIKKCMRENYQHIDHQFDFWHVCKNIKKKLLAASKKKSCSNILSKWIKSICNHFWWACGTCSGDEVLLREKWISVLFHIQDRHKWTGNSKFHRCEHAQIAGQKEWIDCSSDAFMALQLIVLDKTLLGDLKHLTKFSHTGNLEVYHSLYNKWLPKSTHFSYSAMIAKSQLAAIDFNRGSDLKQAKTKSGDPMFNLSFSKVTGNWSVKPMKEKKDHSVFKDLVKRAVDVTVNDLNLTIPQLPDLPKYIASKEKPSKEDVILNQRSRFSL